MRNNDISGAVEAKTGVDGKHLTVFVCADDLQVDPHLDEVSIFADVLDEPPEMDEVGSMGGDDRWRVVELCQYVGQGEIWVAIVERADQPSIDRSIWITTQHRGALHLYSVNQEVECFWAYGDYPPEINSAFSQEPWNIERYETFKPAEEKMEHFTHIYLAHCVGRTAQLAA